MAKKGAQKPKQQGQLIRDVSNMADETEQFEGPLEQTPCSGIGNIEAAEGIFVL